LQEIAAHLRIHPKIVEAHLKIDAANRAQN